MPTTVELRGTRYSLEAIAGKGGNATVYRGRDRTTGALYAVKLLRDVMLLSKTSRERFDREADILASLSHPAVVKYVDRGVAEDGQAFLVMDWIEGESLADRLRTRGVSLAESFTIALRLAETLGYLASRNVLHRDLKPSNVMLVEGRVDRATIVDFGVARKDNGGLTASGTALGTPHYMAPEQFQRAREVDARVDVFALGATLFECLTGRLAFDGRDAVEVFFKLTTRDAPRVRSVRPEVPAAVDDLVAELLRRDRNGRPFADEALHQRLAALAAASPDLARIPRARAFRRPATRPPSLATVDETGPTRASEEDASDDDASDDFDGSLVASSSPRPLAPSLPVPARPLVGRRSAIDTVQSLAQGGARRILLWGAAGVGKTRLAEGILVTSALAPGTGAFVDASLSRTAEDLLPRMALALGIAPPPAATLADLAEIVGRGIAFGVPWVVLDGADRVAGLEALLTLLEGQAPSFRVLVTARARLPLAPGASFEVPPLSCVAEAGPSPAAALLHARALEAMPLLDRETDAPAKLEALAAALEGNPLALELAAARLPVLGLDGALTRAATPLTLLSSASLGEGPRAMREALAWSVDLLDEEERTAWLECAILPAAFGADLAEAFLSPAPSRSSLDLLEALRQKSLLVTSATKGGVRLAVSRALQGLAWERMEASGVLAEVRRRVGARVAPALLEVARQARIPGERAAKERLLAEAENLRAVVDVALESNDPSALGTALSGLVALDAVAAAKGWTRFVVASLDRALAAPAAAAPTLVGRARLVRARHLGIMGRFDVAFEDAAAAIAEARARGDASDLAMSLVEQGILWHRQRRAEEARKAYEEAKDLASAHDDLRSEARAHANLAALHYDTGRLGEARSAYEMAIALLEELEDGSQLGPCFANYAVLLQEQAHPEEARAAYERALGHLREEGDRRREAITLGNVGMLELEAGAAERALGCHEEARRLLAEVADPRSETLCLYRLGATLAVLARFDEGRRAFALAERLRARKATGLDDVALVYTAFLLYAEAKDARTRGDETRGAAAVAEAEERVAKAREAVLGGSSLAADDGRAALRALAPFRNSVVAQARPPSA